MHFVGATQCVRADFRETEILYFASFDEFGHGAYGLLDGCLLIHAVDVVKVDMIDAETLKTLLTRNWNILG
jgi:hypothetical protein